VPTLAAADQQKPSHQSGRLHVDSMVWREGKGIGDLHSAMGLMLGKAWAENAKTAHIILYSIDPPIAARAGTPRSGTDTTMKPLAVKPKQLR
jgi:hypothetical protein